MTFFIQYFGERKKRRKPNSKTYLVSILFVINLYIILSKIIKFFCNFIENIF
jgi:hypothetical protein